MPAAALEVIVDPPDAEVTEFFAQLAQGLAVAVGALLEERQISPPRISLHASNDFAATIAAEHTRLEIPHDASRGLDRVGGVLGGKTLVAGDGSEASVIVPVEYALVSGEAQRVVAEVVVHEFGHVVYERQRDVAVGRPTNAWVPWDVAEMLAVLVSEEFRVDIIGHVMADQLITLTDDAGEPISLASLSRASFEADVAEALDALDPQLSGELHRYRREGGSLMSLWTEIVRASQGVAVYLAHLSAARGLGDLCVGDLDALDHPGFEILRPLWEPLASYLHSSHPFPEPEEWAEDQKELKRIGLEGFTEVWRRLGVAAWPQGDSFYLSVEEPGRPGSSQ